MKNVPAVLKIQGVGQRIRMQVEVVNLALAYDDQAILNRDDVALVESEQPPEKS